MKASRCSQWLLDRDREEAAERARDVLRGNRTQVGFVAAPPDPDKPSDNYTNYDRVWTRDLAWALFWVLFFGDEDDIRSALKGLELVGFAQDENGQIPNFVSRDGRERDHWYLGAVDATLFWLLMVHIARERELVPVDWMEEQVQAALRWAISRQHPVWGLFDQPPASDWMDSLDNRYGFVLSTQALWVAVKRRYGLDGVEKTVRSINVLFFPYRHDLQAEHRRMREMLKASFPKARFWRSRVERAKLGLGYVNPTRAGKEGFVLDNLLCVWAGVVDLEQSVSIIEGLLAHGASKPYPGVCVLWPRFFWMFSRFGRRHKQNRPGEYQNGGIWPFIGGVLVLMMVLVSQLLRENGQDEQARLLMDRAREERDKLIQANKLGGYRFSEYISIRWWRRLAPLRWLMPWAPFVHWVELRGMARQNWNAALLLLAMKAVEDEQVPVRL